MLRIVMPNGRYIAAAYCSTQLQYTVVITVSSSDVQGHSSLPITWLDTY
jgi:hypothetical protein